MPAFNVSWLNLMLVHLDRYFAKALLTHADQISPLVSKILL